MSELAHDPRVSPSAGRTSLKDNQYALDQHQHQQQQQQSKEPSSTNAEFHMGDKAVIQLLSKLDEGTQTIANLRSILALKSAELNELIAQLEMTNQAIVNVESTTTQIETMLKDLGLSEDTTALLMDAEASLDSAIKSATHLYANNSNNNNNNNNSYNNTTHIAYDYPSQPLKARRPSVASNGSGGPQPPSDSDYRREQRMSARFVSRIRYRPDTKHLLRQLNEIMRDLEIDSAKFFDSIGTTEDVQALQKAKVDLDIAKTVALSAKSTLKRRTLLLQSARRRNASSEVELMGKKIREGVTLWKTYARGAPLLVNGQDILSILDREDDLISKNLPVHPSRISFDGYASRRGSPTPSTSTSGRNVRNSTSSRTSESRTHSRRSSVAGESAIPVPAAAAAPPPLPPMPAQIIINKKLHRHSTTAARPAPIRGSSAAVPRARTSSLTASKGPRELKHQSVPVSPPTNARPPLAPPQSPSLIPTPTTEPAKKLGNKTPGPRGPGSTLRIRSMLAKRSHLKDDF
ncbi:hypothetical protein BCR43DRAFT_494565 [Syncephalastrum racemosum]|uniref:Uncharacterized protein n=1 Tax=Syncephalastrum racemosum TaxID=13706 RepID=A0A1X2H8B9_SYNRA|nr:hypothetical protein BCR43DRAFT_494565 [Syncephalastrum racemosum]